MQENSRADLSFYGKRNKAIYDLKRYASGINHVKYAVEVVNEEYGIDLSIEIDKAIKRGEKESIIEKIKEYKQDSDSFNKKRQSTKDYYKNQER